MFFSLLFLYSIHLVTSLSSQEDLSISKYSQIGCLILKSDKQFIVNNIQENFLLPYQIFSSSHMTIELCFRLCRRWIILIYNNNTNCICLYTIRKPYEFSEYLGEIVSINNCTSHDIQIYSLTEDINVLPSLLSSTSDDWSLDGCYYLQGIETIHVSLWLNNVDYIEAIDLCRKHCQIIRGSNYYSYFLSRKKSCYCLPIKFAQTTKTVALRKPLTHCSFLPYICQGFSDSCQKYYSKTNVNTLIKIDVQHYCLSTNSLSFIFDRIFYMCFKSILLRIETTFSIIINYHKCSPLIIKNYEQWNYLIQSSWITYSKTFIWIDRNSTYIFNDLFKFDNLTFSSNQLCLAIMRTDSNKISYELIQCNAAYSSAYVLCAQKPFPSAIPYEEEFKIINNESELFIDEILSCPPEFVLFNKVCYYIHSSFIFDIRSGERVCYNKYSNSTLVKFDLHEWGNINTTRFLGRIFDDILLEFFYYLLEKKLVFESLHQSSEKHWLRLLLGEKNDPNECVLRYFDRSLGGFTLLHRCNDGGHPVCQSEPIRTIISINQTISNINNSQIEIKTESTTTVLLILSNKTILPICENCSTSPPIADEDLVNNETEINSESYNSTLIEITAEQSKKKYVKYEPLIMILTGPILGLIILCIGIGLLIWHLRRNHESYSTHSSIMRGRRTQRSSTTVTTGDVPNTPVVLYARLKPPRLSSPESVMLLPLDNSLPDDDHIEFLPATKLQVINDENEIKEDDDEEPLYATLK